MWKKIEGIRTSEREKKNGVANMLEDKGLSHLKPLCSLPPSLVICYSTAKKTRL
jgi:hypothetical protein